MPPTGKPDKDLFTSLRVYKEISAGLHGIALDGYSGLLVEAIGAVSIDIIYIKEPLN
jgi:hypothetical protein